VCDARSCEQTDETGEEPLMAKIYIRLPPGVALPDVPALIECEGATVAEALADCVARHPRLKGRIFRRDGTPWVGVSVNGRDVPPEAASRTAVEDGAEIRLLPPVGAC
jgi:molybdopterin converting factor small subunit